MSLKVVYGPMFSGKTTDIVETINIYLSSRKNKIVLINSEKDERRDLKSISILSTHSKKQIDFENERIIEIKCKKLEDINKNIFKELIDIIIIDESQFFEDLVTFVKYLLSIEKNIICYGLIANYKMEKFGYLLDIFPYADKIEQKFSVCKKCVEENNQNNKAPFTMKKILSSSPLKNEICIGGDNIYESSCRKHHN
jgi:thymidine kinase